MIAMYCAIPDSGLFARTKTFSPTVFLFSAILKPAGMSFAMRSSKVLPAPSFGGAPQERRSGANSKATHKDKAFFILDMIILSSRCFKAILSSPMKLVDIPTALRPKLR